MRKALFCIAIALALPMLAQQHASNGGFASDFQTVPVMGNTPGAFNANFQTYVALLNPTSKAYMVDVTLYDPAGTAHEATISLAAGEMKAYQNFLSEVFGYTGGGSVTFSAPGNRLLVESEVWTSGTRYGTSIPALEIAATNAPSYAAGVTVDTSMRTNIGCHNESAAANPITATVYDGNGLAVGTVNLNLAAHAWGQAPIQSVVTDGFVKFEPAEAAVCYAVVVTNATNDGRFISATEVTP